MLSDTHRRRIDRTTDPRLNAPFGARCFLTEEVQAGLNPYTAAGFNAPFGARCFLTLYDILDEELAVMVLMHRLALGAF